LYERKSEASNDSDDELQRTPENGPQFTLWEFIKKSEKTKIIHYGSEEEFNRALIKYRQMTHTCWISAKGWELEIKRESSNSKTLSPIDASILSHSRTITNNSFNWYDSHELRSHTQMRIHSLFAGDSAKLTDFWFWAGELHTEIKPEEELQ
jgi:hypothetical protein